MANEQGESGTAPKPEDFDHSPRVQHCCKGRHCCRDNSCKVVTDPKPEPTVENGGLIAGCICGRNIRECGDCSGLLAAIEPKPLLCICTEPPSDDARRAGMSWGGVSETIRGVCPLCQGDAGCPPECRSRKPYGYADAPDWQKAAWDSDTNRIMMEGAKLLAASEKFSWCAPSEVIYGYQNADFILPELSIPRGGIKYPRFSVITHVRSHKAHWWSRKTWTVYVQAWDGTKYDKHEIRGFHTEHDANNAEAIVQFTVKAINNNYEKFEERESAR